MSSPAADRSDRLRPDESDEDFARFYDHVGTAQIEERYYARFDYALARYYLLLRVLAPWARRGAHMLDIACASGYYTTGYAAAGGRATGVDIAPGSVEHAKRRADLSGVSECCTFVVGDMRSLPFDDERFDLILMSEAIEHVREPGDALAELGRVLRPGGTAIIATPNALDWSSPRERLRQRNAPDPEAAGVEVERTGTNVSVADAGIDHDVYFHNAFTFRELEGLHLDAHVNRFRRTPLEPTLDPQQAPEERENVVDFPPPTSASRLIEKMARIGWHLPFLNRMGLEIFLVARRR